MKEVKRALSKAILQEEGIPYLASEICLLYKSTDTERKGYQYDFDCLWKKWMMNRRSGLRML